MKKIINLALIYFLLFSQIVLAQQTCKTYITDEWPDSRYTVTDISGDHVVTDKQTGLMWKQCSEGLSGSDCSVGTLASLTWKEALDIADAEDFAGFADWRVPNQKELRTIVARNCYSPSINTNVFPNTPNDWFWASSPIATNDSNAWIVYFGSGYDGSSGRGGDGRVRLVRSPGQ
ncbi:hypothetical protein GCM10011365_00010 [Marinicella pacifica]|uniref:Lcl C-terminal domain-containing protein n=1 Tax=Marinicella pacifica TaxID=1171543 RepID=A0A917FI28_9GAMM|nr:DUF1566 domain-containing protein [Marinicella pacifica]GGF83085.1 hypothetical protein GCM10011365_00010 [Marinicella pacifica]